VRQILRHSFFVSVPAMARRCRIPLFQSIPSTPHSMVKNRRKARHGWRSSKAHNRRNQYDQISKVKTLFFAGEDRPSFAESYDRLTANCSSEDPRLQLGDAADAAIYFFSGTPGFPKAILHIHQSLMSACLTVNHSDGKIPAVIRYRRFFFWMSGFPWGIPKGGSWRS
jgi:acyl-coenzyme A synthetase/AMP-(fatty) acid ligase